ncbi:hypothetical protein, partial [Paraburkholderia phenoliruptrix]
RFSLVPCSGGWSWKPDSLGFHWRTAAFNLQLRLGHCHAEYEKVMAECERLRVDNAKLLRSGQMMSTIMHNNTVAMQAAWIEWQHGEGAEGAMEWIENTLEGPGLIPEDEEPHATEAQAYFDANKSDRMYDPALDVAIDAARKEQS